MNIIVAVDSQWGIGHQDRLLFRIPEDQTRFKNLTTGKVVILGRRTLETLPGRRPLRNRTNIILTRSSGFTAEPAIICHSLDDLKRQIQDIPAEDVFVIGGTSVYQLLLPYCQAAYVTKIDARRPADSFFPDLDRLPGWQLAGTESHQTDAAWITGEEGPVTLTFHYCLYRQDKAHELR
jgi:dihydrofolate reductase